MLPRKFRVISSSLTCTLISWSSRESSFIIFERDRFQYSLFGLNMLPVRFRTILRQQPFSRAKSRKLISVPSWEHSFYNFHARPFPIFVIWPKFATYEISRDSDTVTFFAYAIVHANIRALPRELLLQFSRATASNNRYLV